MADIKSLTIEMGPRSKSQAAYDLSLIAYTVRTGNLSRLPDALAVGPRAVNVSLVMSDTPKGSAAGEN